MPHTLLLADDSTTIQRVIELTFADQDIAVVCVGDGDRAIATLDQTKPDIVLADVGMPGRNGYEVARYIRSTPHLAHIPVVLLTGAFEPVDQARARELGCAGVLVKPFEPQLVIRRVRELLGLQPEQAALAATTTRAPERAAHEPSVSADVPSTPEPRPNTSIDSYLEELDQALAAHVAARTDRPLAPGGDDRAPSPQSAEVAPAPEAGRHEGGAPLMVDAFSALLAAESSPVDDLWATLLPAAPSSSSAPPVGPSPAITDDVIETIVQRVLERMTDRVVRETVSEAVLSTAERVVREEIERVKSNIK